MFNQKLFQGKYRIKSTRLPHWNYSQPGYYFVTICTKGRVCRLGRVIQRQMYLSLEGKIVQECWYDLPNHYPHIGLDEFIVMPNHVHGVVVIYDNVAVETGLKPVSTIPVTVSEIIRGFKTFSAKRINQLRNTPGQPFWQSRFYDHIIRNEKSLNNIRKYIQNNPAKWERDRNNS